MKTIEILVSPKGETSLKTKGFAGAACRDASRFLEQTLGKRLDERLTAEFHQRLVHQQKNLQGHS